MAAQTDTWTNILVRIQALMGVDTLLTTESTLLGSLINRRIYQAYRASDSWARYLVVGQARPGPLNIIPFSYTTADGNRNISTATRSGTTVTITTSADIDGDLVTGMYVTIASLTYSTVDPNGVFQITVSGDDTFTYETTTGTGTETYGGSGTVVAVALPDVDSFIRVHAAFPKNLVSAREYDFYVQSDGCHIIGNSSVAAGFWVTYKKEWAGPYDITTNPNIPLEFFEYAAHAAYADFLRLDKQNSKAMAEEQVAQQYLLIELERPQNQANNQVISRFRSHGTEQSR